MPGCVPYNCMPTLPLRWLRSAAPIFSQDMHQATVNKDIERQQSYLDKMKAEVR